MDETIEIAAIATRTWIGSETTTATIVTRGAANESGTVKESGTATTTEIEVIDGAAVSAPSNDEDRDPSKFDTLILPSTSITSFIDLSLARRSRDRRDRDQRDKNDVKNEAEEAAESAVVVKREPLSLEELLAKKKADEEAKSKPKFLTKEERAAEAVRKRQEEVENQRKQQDEERQKRNAFFQV